MYDDNHLTKKQLDKMQCHAAIVLYLEYGDNIFNVGDYINIIWNQEEEFQQAEANGKIIRIEPPKNRIVLESNLLIHQIEVSKIHHIECKTPQ